MRSAFVLTRLHARYDANDMKDDLVFKAAPPIVGGREFLTDGKKLEEGSRPGSRNNFQGRYAIRHEWTGPIECENPVRGRWGGPPSGTSGTSGATPATDLAFVKRGATKLPMVVAQDVPELGLVAGKAVGASAAEPEEPAAAANASEDGAETESSSAPGKAENKKDKGCAVSGDAEGGFALLLLALVGLRRRRRVWNKG
jgi:MYXO-CTERM domain-containing protein